MGLHTTPPHPTQSQLPSQGASDQPFVLPKQQHQPYRQQQQQKHHQQRQQNKKNKNNNHKTKQPQINWVVTSL